VGHSSAPRWPPPAARTGRGDAAEEGDLGEGRDGRFRFQGVDHESAPEELASVLQGADDLTYLGQENGGVRSAGMLEVPAGRGGGRRGFRTTAFCSFSPQIHN
jgi:hypothetical protein